MARGEVRTSVLVAAIACLTVSSTARAATMAYRLRYGQPGDAWVTVSLVPSAPLTAPRVLVIPRAIPMGYIEAPYDRFVEDVRAVGPAGESLPVSREDGPRWRVGAEGTSLARVEYRVNVARMEETLLAASDASRARSAYLSILGYSVFAYFDGLEDTAITLEVEGPRGWPVLTTLSPGDASATIRTASVSNYYALADSQIVMGTGMRVRQVTSAAPLTVVVYAEAEADVDLVAELASTALRRVADYFATVPFAHYTVVQEYLKPLSPRHEYGFSMEHLDSSTFSLAVETAVSSSSSATARRRALYNYAHHISHAWVPKRSYGEGYYPFTWELAPVIDSIWFSEGFAQYAAIEAVAAGEPDAAGYRRRMIDFRFAEPLAAMPEFLKRMSLVQLSRVASTRYSDDFRTGRSSFARGGLMAADVDERIRARTGGAKGLKDALRFLVAWSTRNARGFRVEELPGLFREATGVETSDVFARWLAPMPAR